jgi:hypothetical protein
MLAYLRQPETPELPRQQTLPLLENCAAQSRAHCYLSALAPPGEAVSVAIAAPHIFYLSPGVLRCVFGPSRQW